jgi:hypothetical protein
MWRGAVVRSSALVSPASPAPGHFSPSTPAPQRRIVSGPTPQVRTAPRPANNVYAAPDGHVFRRATTGWEHHDGATWQRTEPRAEEHRVPVQHLEAEHRAREVGAFRAEHVRQPVPQAQPQFTPPTHQQPQAIPPGLRGGGTSRHHGR